jgi:hypothetical protein
MIKGVFGVQRSTFNVQRSTFNVWRLAFGVWRAQGAGMYVKRPALPLLKNRMLFPLYAKCHARQTPNVHPFLQFFFQWLTIVRL